jgi:hypothetical protein
VGQLGDGAGNFDEKSHRIESEGGEWRGLGRFLTSMRDSGSP